MKISKTLRAEKARRAKDAAARLFPGEKWIKLEPGIFLSPRRKTGHKSNFKDELRDAQILRDTGSTVYLVPEDTKSGKKQYDAIVDGLEFEFKNVGGIENTLIKQFLRSRTQAHNVFINLEESPLSKHKIMKTLYEVRNSYRYSIKSRDNFGGKLILKVNETNSLIYVNIDKLIKKTERIKRSVSKSQVPLFGPGTASGLF